MINAPHPEPNLILAGYAALINQYELDVASPESLTAISQKSKRYTTGIWQVFPSIYAPKDDLLSQLSFALKYEGLDLAVLNSLFNTVSQAEIEAVVKSKPNGKNARRIWFLYEWLKEKKLNISDAKQGNYINLMEGEHQYPGPSRLSKRHRVRNNLPGVKNFCPLVRRTTKIDQLIEKDLPALAQKNIGAVHPDILMRASAYLLLADSKASYAIEGETPPRDRAESWGRVIGQAGQTPLSRQEFVRLQKVVLGESPRFVSVGYRKEGGFIGTHDRSTRMPIPDHISARPEDLDALMEGLVETAELLKEAGYPAILAASAISFGFVFIHPFEDGNGRLHRYLLHHILAITGFTPKGMVFPVSSVILKDMLSEYRRVLECYSRPRLPLIEWRETSEGNVEVLNDTIDLYRYFDATQQAEFLYDCVLETITTTLPNEVQYLQRYDEMKRFIINDVDMPDQKADLLVHFLYQNQGKFSKRARNNEFKGLQAHEIARFEEKFAEIFDLPESAPLGGLV